MTALERMQAVVRGELPPPNVSKLLGFRMVEIEPGRSKFEFEATEEHSSPPGSLHGGVLCDVADAAMGTAYLAGLEEGESFATLELKINFLRPFWTGKLFAAGTVVNRGRTIGLAECEVTDERGRLIAKATSTCMTLRGERGND